MIKPTPKKIRDELSQDRFMKSCCLFNLNYDCTGKIEWHHHLKFKGERVNEKWCLLPLCKYHHYHEAVFKNELDRIMVSRATEEELKQYSKAIDYVSLKRKYENTN